MRNYKMFNDIFGGSKLALNRSTVDELRSHMKFQILILMR